MRGGLGYRMYGIGYVDFLCNGTTVQRYNVQRCKGGIGGIGCMV